METGIHYANQITGHLGPRAVEERPSNTCISATAASQMTTESPMGLSKIPDSQLLLRTYCVSSTVLGLVPVLASQHCFTEDEMGPKSSVTCARLCSKQEAKL